MSSVLSYFLSSFSFPIPFRALLCRQQLQQIEFWSTTQWAIGLAARVTEVCVGFFYPLEMTIRAVNYSEFRAARLYPHHTLGVWTSLRGPSLQILSLHSDKTVECATLACSSKHCYKFWTFVTRSLGVAGRTSF